MSGGSYNYIGLKIQDIDVMWVDSPQRRAFQNLLKLVGEAMYDIEWVDSGDYGPGDENKAIEKCLDYLGGSKALIKAAAFDALADKLKVITELK